MSISKDNENQNEEGHDCGNPDCDHDHHHHHHHEPHDLRVVMKQLEENETIPEGFVMVFMFGDPEESQITLKLISFSEPWQKVMD